MKQLVLAGRLVFGAWMLLNGANYLFFSFWPMPAGHEPLATQLMDALVHSRLLDVAMTIQLVTGALILTGFFVPVALCVVMPISTCALYWSVILDHQPLGVVLSIAAFALNGLLMLAYLEYYKAVLHRSALMLGETGRSSFDLLFAKLNGRTSRSQFIPAAITLVAVIVFYAYLVPYCQKGRLVRPRRAARRSARSQPVAEPQRAAHSRASRAAMRARARSPTPS